MSKATKCVTSVALEPSLVARVDRIAAASGCSRSCLFAEALRVLCDANEASDKHAEASA
jgi:predicted transcriptional regulator